MFEVEKTAIKGCYIIRPKVFKDDRGYFLVPYHAEEINKIIGSQINFIQDNKSFSVKGVIRGLHFQKNPYSQNKLVTCLSGHVLDVIVDIDKNSPTYGQHVTVDLISDEHKMVFVPNHCAHGFSVISDTALFYYKVDNLYNKDSEESIRFDDPELGINWKVASDIQKLSDKDSTAKLFKYINF